MKLRLRVIDPSESNPGDITCVVAIQKQKRNPKEPPLFDQKLAVLEVFEAPAMEWEPVEVVVLETSKLVVPGMRR